MLRASGPRLNNGARQRVGCLAVIMIRPAKSSDAAFLAAIAERTFRETFAIDNTEENINLHCARKFSVEMQGEERVIAYTALRIQADGGAQ